MQVHFFILTNYSALVKHCFWLNRWKTVVNVDNGNVADRMITSIKFLAQTGTTLAGEFFQPLPQPNQFNAPPPLLIWNSSWQQFCKTLFPVHCWCVPNKGTILDEGFEIIIHLIIIDESNQLNWIKQITSLGGKNSIMINGQN